MSAFRIKTGSLGKIIRFLGCITLHAFRTPVIIKSISRNLSQRAFVLLLVPGSPERGGVQVLMSEQRCPGHWFTP